MINSGITRRIDELGRIVVPKELRNNLGIRDGEPLLISTQDDSIIIKKFSKIETIEEKINKYVKIFMDSLDIKILITDREKVINNEAKENIDSKLKDLIDNRESYKSENQENILNLNGYFIIEPIISSSDSIGLVILYSETNHILNYEHIAKILSKLIIAW